jgi:hypothetical protein
VHVRSAGAQAGIVTRAQARAAGLSDDAIDYRLGSRRWQRLYAGVLATFSGPVSRAARLWAVVLATGPEAMISHITAAELWGLASESLPDLVVHVTVPASRRIAAPSGVVVHRSRHFTEARHPALAPPAPVWKTRCSI